MFLGLDVGTSAVKAVLVGEDLKPAAEAEAPLLLDRPHRLWSEQHPDAWIAAADEAVLALPADLRAQVQGVGLSGQMHGAVLLGADGRPLRPAILWNDGRAHAECAALEAAVPDSRVITGNKAMPGLTAPKLLWVREHEPEIFARIAKVLLPKDYLRLHLTGDHATDFADASGTLFLDVGAERWSPAMLAACGLGEAHMPTLHESSAVSGRLRRTVAARWGTDTVPVAGGAGDNAAGALGAGVIRPGEALLILGTSGVVFAATKRFQPNPDKAVHAFRHAATGVWHQTAVILSAAASLDWAARTLGYQSAGAALAALEAAPPVTAVPIFLPYLSGERAPHDDPDASGVFFGLTHETSREAMIQAVLEGVAFALADCADAMRAGGARLDRLHVTGGGARSALWGEILASTLNAELVYREAAALGPACGAAFCARSAVTGEPLPGVDALSSDPWRAVRPDPERQNMLEARRARFKPLYPALAAHMKGLP